MGERYNEGEVVAEEAGTEKAAERKIGFMSRVYESTPVRAIGFAAAGGAAVLGTVIPAKAQTQNGEITKSEISAECRSGDDVPDGKEARLIHTIETSHDADFALFAVLEDRVDGSVFDGTIGAENERSFDLSWEETLPDGTESIELYHGANFDLDGGFGGGGRDVERTEEEEEYVDFTEPVELVYPCEDEDNNEEEEENIGGPDPVDEEDIAGSNRYETTIKVSQKHYDSAETVVIATGENYPDALAGGPLGSMVNGPILLTGSGALHGGVANELRRLGTQKVYLLGGENAISGNVENQLGSRGIAVTRLGGSDRFETAAEIAEEINTTMPEVAEDSTETTTATVDNSPETVTAEAGEVIIVSGEDFPDAVAASSLASRREEGENPSPILLTGSEQLPAATRESLGEWQDTIERVTVVGGRAVVSNTVEQTAARDAGASTSRLAGSSRFATSIRVAEEDIARQGQNVTRSYIATGSDYPDALTAGPAAATHEGSILALVDKESTEVLDPYKNFVAEHKTEEWDLLTFIGGTAAISGNARNHVATITNQ